MTEQTKRLKLLIALEEYEIAGEGFSLIKVIHRPILFRIHQYVCFRNDGMADAFACVLFVCWGVGQHSNNTFNVR